MRIVCLLLALLSVACANRPQPPRLVLEGASLVDIRSGGVSQHDIVVRGALIERITPALKGARSGDTVLNARGLFAIPGLWDAHVHLTFNRDLTESILRLLSIHGVTGVIDRGGRLEDVLAIRERAAAAGDAPHVYISGPLLDGAPRVFDGKGYGPELGVSLTKPSAAVAILDRLSESGVKVVKPYNMLDEAVFEAIVHGAHERGMMVDGHVPFRLGLRRAMSVGIDGIQHLHDLGLACSSRSEKILLLRNEVLDASDINERGWAISARLNDSFRDVIYDSYDDELCRDAIEEEVRRSIWRTPTLVSAAHRALRFYDSPGWYNAYELLPPKVESEWRAVMKEFADDSRHLHLNSRADRYLRYFNLLHEAGAKMLAGTDTSALPFVPGASLHYELEAFVAAGSTPLEALQSATLNVAEYLGEEDRFGALEPGLSADIVLLSANPLADIRNTRRIERVIVKGRIVERLIERADK